ncbi:MAG: DUF4160 domain-containing protein [Erysipelotrichaceae bacterium]|nr:DUF4160 domain-containing protein [Erysipelotrichaceae bacterium]
MKNKIIMIKVHKEQMTLVKLRSAVVTLSNNLGDRDKKPYKVSVRKILPIETDLVTVGTLNNNIKFEVREKESSHNVAHFHITIRGEGGGSYRISDFSVIESNIPKRTEKKLLEWARENRQILVDTWNEFHGFRVVVE